MHCSIPSTPPVAKRNAINQPSLGRKIHSLWGGASAALASAIEVYANHCSCQEGDTFVAVQGSAGYEYAIGNSPPPSPETVPAPSAPAPEPYLVIKSKSRCDSTADRIQQQLGNFNFEHSKHVQQPPTTFYLGPDTPASYYQGPLYFADKPTPQDSVHQDIPSSALSTSSSLAGALGSPIICSHARLPDDYTYSNAGVSSNACCAVIYNSEYGEYRTELEPNMEPQRDLDSDESLTFIVETGMLGDSKSRLSHPRLDTDAHEEPVRTLKRRGPAKRPQKDKNFLACYFCRGRKIACNVPDAGSANRTCEQCAKRNLQCEYPTVSRRGQRDPASGGHKKKMDKDDYVPKRVRCEAHRAMQNPVPSPTPPGGQFRDV